MWTLAIVFTLLRNAFRGPHFKLESTGFWHALRCCPVLLLDFTPGTKKALTCDKPAWAIAQLWDDHLRSATAKPLKGQPLP